MSIFSRLRTSKAKHAEGGNRVSWNRTVGLICPELHFASHRRVIGRIETDFSDFELRSRSRLKVQVEGSEILLYLDLVMLWLKVSNIAVNPLVPYPVPASMNCFSVSACLLFPMQIDCCSRIQTNADYSNLIVPRAGIWKW